MVTVKLENVENHSQIEWFYLDVAYPELRRFHLIFANQAICEVCPLDRMLNNRNRLTILGNRCVMNLLQPLIQCQKLLQIEISAMYMHGNQPTRHSQCWDPREVIDLKMEVFNMEVGMQ